MFSSHDVAVIQCHKNRMTTRVITDLRVHVSPMTTTVPTVRVLIEIMFILKVIKFHFNDHMIYRI